MRPKPDHFDKIEKMTYIIIVFACIRGQNRFFIRTSANQLSRNPDKKRFEPPDIPSKTDKTVTLPYT